MAHVVNPCIRCGKAREMTKKWEEEVQTYAGVSVVTHASYSCPDDQCQEKVDLGIEEQRRLAAERQHYAQKRAEARAIELAKPRKRQS